MPAERLSGQNIITEHTLDHAALHRQEVVGVIISRMVQAYGEAGGDLGRFVVTSSPVPEDDIKVFGPGLIVRIEGWHRQ